MQNADLEKIAKAFDKIIVSLDGDKEKHESRRGTGTYTCNNKQY